MAQQLRELRTAPGAPHGYGVDSGVTLADLARGVHVTCDVISFGPRWWTSEVPCCGRRVKVPSTTQTDQWAMCTHCGVLYLADLEEEAPEYGDQPVYVAVFTVFLAGITTARPGRARP